MCQIQWVDCTSDKIDDRLICRQSPIGRFSQADRPFDHDIAARIDKASELVIRQYSPMLLSEPEYHLISDEHAKLLLKFTLGLRETARNRHQRATENPLQSDGADESLQVRREPKRDKFGIAEGWSLGGHGGNELRSPYRASASGNGNFVWKSSRNLHNVRHEGNGGELIRKMPPEKPKGGIGRVNLLAVFKQNRGRDEFILDGNKHFHAHGRNLFLRRLSHSEVRRHVRSTLDEGFVTYRVSCLRYGTDFIHRE